MTARVTNDVDKRAALYEGRGHPPLSNAAFAWRLLRHGAVALSLIAFSLGVGMAGYSYYENLHWRDAFLNAAMLLAGEGPVHVPATPAGKLFAGLYALYAGLIFLVIAGMLLAPVMHRVLHRFHWEGKSRGDR